MPDRVLLGCGWHVCDKPATRMNMLSKPRNGCLVVLDMLEDVCADNDVVRLSQEWTAYRGRLEIEVRWHVTTRHARAILVNASD
jgi:hypothetical protein